MKLLEIRFWSVLSLLALGAACTQQPTASDGRRLGVIVFHDDPVVISVPDTVVSGVAFEVSVRTHGGGCISQNGTEVRIDGRTAHVIPWDVHSGGAVCTTELRHFEHTATLMFPGPGPAEVRIHGAEVPADSAVVFVRKLHVR